MVKDSPRVSRWNGGGRALASIWTPTGLSFPSGSGAMSRRNTPVEVASCQAIIRQRRASEMCLGGDEASQWPEHVLACTADRNCARSCDLCLASQSSARSGCVLSKAPVATPRGAAVEPASYRANKQARAAETQHGTSAFARYGARLLGDQPLCIDSTLGVAAESPIAQRSPETLAAGCRSLHPRIATGRAPIPWERRAESEASGWSPAHTHRPRQPPTVSFHEQLAGLVVRVGLLPICVQVPAACGSQSPLDHEPAPGRHPRQPG